ncbi:hypothetical protein Tco_0332343 [Tanacetum coccineum]
MSNRVLRCLAINLVLSFRSAPSIQLFVHSWCVTENTAGVDDLVETMQNVGVRNMSKCQVLSFGIKRLTSVTSPEVVNCDDKKGIEDDLDGTERGYQGRKARSGIEEMQLNSLAEISRMTTLVPCEDRYVWTLESDGVFSVASIRKEIDGNRFQDVSLPD